MVASIKRKDVKEISALILEANGEDERAQEVRSASRMTSALVDRTITPLRVDAEESEANSNASEEAIGDGSEGAGEATVEDDKKSKKKEKKGKGKKEKKGKGKGKTDPEPEATVADASEAEPEGEAEDKLTVGDIKTLVESGKKKKIQRAKEAFKAQFGKDHPNYKELKKLFKKVK